MKKRYQQQPQLWPEKQRERVKVTYIVHDCISSSYPNISLLKKQWVCKMWSLALCARHQSLVLCTRHAKRLRRRLTVYIN